MITFRELLQQTSYKKIFNEIYASYYKSKVPTSKISEADSQYLCVYNKLLSLEGKKQENLYIYLVETTAFDGESFVDVCLYDESSDEIFAMDFVDWSEVIDLKIKNTIKLSDAQVLSYILWEITFWGFSQETIKDQANLLDK